MRRSFPLLALLTVTPLAACRKTSPIPGADAGETAQVVAVAGSAAVPMAALGAPKLVAIAMQVNVYSRPDSSSKKLGYLRLGGQVVRDAEPAGDAGCPGGWYHIAPRGYVCRGEDASLDIDHPIARAAAVRPDTSLPLPYRYAFVRAVAPLYLRIPSAREQRQAEFKLDEHLEWWKKDGVSANKVIPGANDAIAASLPGRRPSTELAMGELYGGNSDNDAIPFWLQAGRTIPNVSDFKVPSYAFFANRVRRHTGLALIGSFPTGPESLERRFAVTTDLRLVPASKLKPDTGSAFHGTELGNGVDLPVAFVRTECDRDGPCAHPWRIASDGAHEEDRKVPWRKLVKLSGKTKRVGISLYRETTDGTWLKASDLAVISAPSEWPAAAQGGQKWIDVSIENQTLTLWEGQKAVYATLVSTGQDGLGDPKTTKSTVTGAFRIKTKHVTATMDSNERSNQSGGAAPAPPTAEPDTQASIKSKPLATDASGRQLRRGEGTFELRDVPYVQYFESGYALHAAYWHDVFGKARSHGCVNLAPVDAHRVFAWTDPPMPEGWHGVVSTAEAAGTSVLIHK